MTASTLVSFRHVRKSWQQVTALQNFSLDIAAGELVVLVGSSGCGKSTLLRMLIGLEPVTQGEIRINGEPVRGVGKERGIVFQEPRLFPWLTVIDNVMLGLADEKLSRGVKRQRALAMLERVQLQEFAHALPSRLSGGMAQRVAIARGLIASPQILMLDEPFGALDALTRHTLQQELLHIHRSAGTTTLLVTHDVEEAVALADRVVVLSPRPGRIREVVTLALPHPRQRDDESFSAACRQIRNLITCA
ncbi:ABC transporter ATP-binding protein [Raoultella ornithinolytica]|jgi:sulfonate transport system ATP-binding protein|uniref:ABC transporter ATP-binding protein n=2 Tax=Raoultella ornithinolytica TaxID=54291 RepID=A0A1Y6GLX7_RAOOR|nr:MULTISPECIES: ABC transporter ATP-binding protein [Raoultella]AGJ87446.1 alkanesulfonates ABC transporter ATP-binding protein / Sulfonate ABC transporter [Raoultella ornithinolytica B6]ALQ48327.1 Alkanesulfonates ABC transporter ATP-binding protein [Raoultella ornithinolytica]ANZ04629.1 ABC transporter ATP-binding protein [Raoultella ornithinolytica]ATM22619.1 ABC transporter ATP-binding protein [Raoultella ornithinolytica]EJD6310593.1 ABC transporter ATP-binding protein [Raoultella ornithi